MRTKVFVVVVLALLGQIFVASLAQAGHKGFATAQATQHPMNQSGAAGRIDFTETEAGLVVSGTATGLQPSVGRYLTLVYDVGSVPGGPTACEPTVELEGMFVGIWAVDGSGNGTLLQLSPDVAPLGTIDTVSIRDTAINNGFGPEAVVACGQIAVQH